MNHHEQYEKTAREWVQKYAKKDIVTEKEQMVGKGKRNNGQIEKAVKRGKDRNYVHTVSIVSCAEFLVPLHEPLE